MNPPNLKQYHRFHNIEFDVQLRQLNSHNKSVALTKKQHQLMLLLVESENQIIDKDTLISALWPDQIITDAALNKQITRMRQTLQHFSDAPMIETIRGVGVRFTPEVNTQELANDANATHSKPSLLAGAVVLVLLLGFILTQWWRQSNSMHFPSHQMAIIPGSANSNWLNTGGVHHLANALDQWPDLQVTSIEDQWFGHPSSEQLGVELTADTGIGHVLIFDARADETGYAADVVLRDPDQILAKKQFKAPALNQLYEQIQSWTHNHMNLAETINKALDQTTDFVLENHIRGLAAKQARQFSQAKSFFDIAIQQDPQFLPSKIERLGTLTELGEFDLAYHLSDEHLKESQADSPRHWQLQLAKVHALTYLNRVEEAQELLDQVNTGDPKAHMQKLGYQFMIDNYRGNLGQSNLKDMQALLQLSQLHNPLPSVLGGVHYNLATVQMSTNDLDGARENLNASIQHYKQVNHAAGLVWAIRYKAEIQARLADGGNGLITLKQAEPWIDQVDEVRFKALYLMSLANLQFSQGMQSEAQQVIDQIKRMSVTHATQQPMVKALLIETDWALAYQNHDAAALSIAQALGIITQNPELYPMDAPIAVSYDLYLTCKTQPADQCQTKLNGYFSTHPVLEDILSTELVWLKALALAQSGFHKQAVEQLLQLEQHYTGQQRLDYANAVAHDIMAIQWQHQDDQLSQTIGRYKNRNHFVYPVQKYQAMLNHRQGRVIEAVATLKTLKKQSGAFWTAADQLLLESLQDDQAK